ncbi:MAG: YIP1 family protein [Planctomycetota bacterium]|nr:MAG: YIP1 family protein [Planctomycetota bacterium]
MSQPEHSAHEASPPASPNPYDSPRAAIEPSRPGVVPGYERLNPWRSIWTQPRATIRQIVDTNPTNMVVLLAAIGGISQALDQAAARGLGGMIPMPAVLGVALVFGPILGLISLYVGGAVLWFSGRLLGGAANYEHVRAALGWSQVPLAFGLVLWIPKFLALGPKLFDGYIFGLVPVEQNLLIATGVAEVVLGIWQLVILINCLAEVHQFSRWRGLGTLLAAGALIGLAVFIPAMIFFMSAGGGGL